MVLFIKKKFIQFFAGFSSMGMYAEPVRYAMFKGCNSKPKR